MLVSKVCGRNASVFALVSLEPKAASLLADLEAAGGSDGRGGGDSTRQVAVLQRLVQAACQCPADIETHLGDILKVTYFQTGVRPLRTLSYTLLAHCRQAWPEASAEWDNVVGSAMKDVESPDVELQCAALKALAFVPVVKMVAHLERARINLPAALVSAHATVRRQACTTMSVLLLERFSSKQVAAFAPLWVAPITRVLWTDADASVLSAAGLFLNQLPSGPLRDAFVAEFAAVPYALFLVSDRIRLLMLDCSCAPLLQPLAVVAAQSPQIAEWFAGTVLIPRLGDPAPKLVMTEAARALRLLGDSRYAMQANSVLLAVSPRHADWNLPLPLEVAVRAVSAFPRSATRIYHLSLVFAAHMQQNCAEVAQLLASSSEQQTSGELLLAAIVAARRLRSVAGLQACLSSLAGGWPKTCLRAAFGELGTVPPELASAALTPLTLGEQLAVSFVIALGAGVAEDVDAASVLSRADWKRVSSDSSPLEVECRHAIKSDAVYLAMRVTNNSGVRMANVRLQVGVGRNVVLTCGSVQHQVTDLGPGQSVTFQGVLPLTLPLNGPLLFVPSVVLFPAASAPTSSGALAGRSFSCVSYAASMEATRRPIRNLSPADFSQFWNIFPFSCVENIRATAVPDLTKCVQAHGCFVSASAAIVRAQLACATCGDMMLLLLVQAEKRGNAWVVRIATRSHCSDALLELKNSGGAASVIGLKGVPL